MDEVKQWCKMPMLGLGTVKIDDHMGVETIFEAIDLGYRLIDTARMYYNKEMIGQAISQSV